MARSKTATIKAANTTLIVNGDLEAVGDWRDMVTSEFREGLVAEDWVVTDLAEKLWLGRKR